MDQHAMTTEEWIEKAKEVHGDKYDYSGVIYKKNRIKVSIICKEHEEFLQTPNHHLQGSGCPKCSKAHIITTEEWVLQAKVVHGDKYDYIKSEYRNCDTKIIIICPEHGQFAQTPSCHLQNGCPKCSGKCVTITNNCSGRTKRT